MKHLIIFWSLTQCLISAAQSYETSHTKGYSSTFCGEEKFEFHFGNDKISKTDHYYNTTETVPSRRDDGQFDDAGNYVEYWTPKFYLEENGSSDYYSIPKFYFRIAYDKKGGNLLYILEIPQAGNSLATERAKYYFTNLGYETFCKK